MAITANNMKYVELTDLRVSYRPGDDSIHLVSTDPDLPTGLHLPLSPGTTTEAVLRELLQEKGIISSDSPVYHPVRLESNNVDDVIQNPYNIDWGSMPREFAAELLNSVVDAVDEENSTQVIEVFDEVARQKATHLVTREMLMEMMGKVCHSNFAPLKRNYNLRMLKDTAMAYASLALPRY